MHHANTPFVSPAAAGAHHTELLVRGLVHAGVAHREPQEIGGVVVYGQHAHRTLAAATWDQWVLVAVADTIGAAHGSVGTRGRHQLVNAVRVAVKSRKDHERLN